MHDKVKNWILLANIVIAIIITVLSQKSINEALENDNLDEDKEEYIKQSLTNLNFIFWMLLLYDLVLGCFKLSIILTLCILCLPCLVYFIAKTTREN